ncbi:hematopoietic SH2 domain-containing protein isoform X2 [Pteronotus mesoamericanus]|uniref:hematopoietic SH2 domain-containing protein isoform X2 n=1 Tax=Pteronotus mesoamericanus TaxID=1884717 RepID=UPI0023EB825E|nr:hematopoietic SH2 domain-containing protein isoform X2 [Pteronotus parnellii mesoamericanus]
MTETRKLPPPLPPRMGWDAESLLESEPLGSFLIRVSHSHVGYTLSYKAPGCYRHFMVKLLDNGSFLIPGEDKTHASLDALVTFHQQQPIRPHGELLKQPCGQKDPTSMDYEDLFLYYNALAEEDASPSPGPSDHQNPSSHPVAAPMEVSGKPVLLHQREERQLSAEMDRAPTEEAASFCPPRSPLEKACQKLWGNLKTLPQTGKRVQQQLKSHLAAVSLSSFLDSKRREAEMTHSAGAEADAAVWDSNAYRDPSVAPSLTSPSQPQAPRDKDKSSRRASRSTSWSDMTPSTRGWQQKIVRALSSQPSKSELRDLAGPQEDHLPEEYRPPPPFAPGYC